MAFYRTQLKSTGAGYATDINGKRLTFIGNLPCQAGDTVWTDGKVIFGNVSPKPQPVFFDEEPSGIPVILEDEEGTIKTGYFDSQGNFKKYKIPYYEWNFGDNVTDEQKKLFAAWFLNDKKTFLHGTLDLSNINWDNLQDYDNFTHENILDREISNEGDLLTAVIEKGEELLRIVNGEIKSDAVVTIKRNDTIIQRVQLSNFVSGIITDAEYAADCYWGQFRLDRNANWYATFGVEGICERSIKTQNVFGLDPNDAEIQHLIDIGNVPDDSMWYVDLLTSFSYEKSFCVSATSGGYMYYSHLIAASGSSTQAVEYWYEKDLEATVIKQRYFDVEVPPPDTSAVEEVDSEFDIHVQDNFFTRNGKLCEGDKIICDGYANAAVKIKDNHYLILFGSNLWEFKNGDLKKTGITCYNGRLRKLQKMSKTRR